MTTANRHPIEPHAVHRDRLLEHAERMLAEGDRLQASEKIWGAVAHGLKAVAGERGWPYETHADAGVIASYVANQVAQPDISVYFRAIRDLHRNFYDDEQEIDEIRDALGYARRMLDLLNAAHAAMPPDTPMPTSPQYRARAQRRAGAQQ